MILFTILENFVPCVKEKFEAQSNLKITNCHQWTTSMTQDYHKGTTLGMNCGLDRRGKIPKIPQTTLSFPRTPEAHDGAALHDCTSSPFYPYPSYHTDLRKHLTKGGIVLRLKWGNWILSPRNLELKVSGP